MLLPFNSLMADEIPAAILSEDSTTLTFTYVPDTCTFTYRGTGIHTLDYRDLPGWYGIKRTSGEYYSPIRKVIFDKSFAKARPSRTDNWFSGCYYLDSIVGIEYLNTDSVKDMMQMFEDCHRLKHIDVSRFNTRNVTNMNGMFYCCREVEELDVSGFCTDNVNDMSSMFSHCENVKALDVSKFNTSKVTDMYYMFQCCYKLTSLDVSNFNTENVKGFSCMFVMCPLDNINVSNFKTSKAEDFGYMFYGCSNITRLDISNFDTGRAKDILGLFSKCTKLTTINIGNNDFAKVRPSSQLKGTGSDMWPCYLITGEQFNDSVLGQPSASGFYNWRGGWFSLSRNVNVGFSTVTDNDEGGKTMTFTAKAVDLETQDIQDVTGNNSTSGAKGNTGWNPENGNAASGIRRAGDSEPLAWQITKVVFDESFSKVFPSTTETWFMNMKNLNRIVGIENLNTSEVTSMNGMFAGCASLESVNLSHFSTGKVTDMGNMFYGCSSLKSIDAGKFSTSSLTHAYQMFEGCTSLTRADIRNFSFNGNGSVWRMFYGCTALKDLILGDNDFKDREDGEFHVYYSADSAFAHVGSPETPCQLYTGKNFDKGVLGTKAGNCYEWLAGYFYEPKSVTDGISSVACGEDGYRVEAPAYNLAGQRVGREYKGVVIVNGRKVLRR